ncbi:MAG: ATP-binding protein [Verrucomicrobiota bacterium]
MSIIKIMIHSLAIKNFSSFHEPTFIEFTTGPKAGDRDIFLASAQEGVSVNSVTGIFGPNASGKTNLLKAIGFLRYFILHSASEKPDDPIPVERFEFVDPENQELDIHFRIEFEWSNILFRYELELNKERVIAESLHRKDQRFRYLFEREWNQIKQAYDFKSQDIGPSKQITQRENASFLSSAVLQEHKFANEIASYFKTCYVNIHFGGRMPTHDPETMNVLQASKYYESNANFLKSAEQHIIAADLGISAINIEEARFLDEEGNETKTPFPVVKHCIADTGYKRPLLQESRGTQALFVLLRYILPVLKTGGVAVIDEFETGLHSHIVKYVVELFHSKTTNPNGAQLIANFHTDYLLQSTLEKYQIVFTEKNPDTQSTEAWRLDKVKGVARNANNHYAKYHAGVYGGIPNL